MGQVIELRPGESVTIKCLETPTTEPSVPPTPLTRTRQLGVNLEWNNRSQTSNYFIDAFKSAEIWGTVDADGWPNDVNNTIYFQTITKGNPTSSGIWKLRYKAAFGTTVTGGSCVVSNPQIKPDGYTEASIIVGSEITDANLYLKFNNPSLLSITDIRIIRPGYTITDANTSYFTKKFLRSVSPFTCIRTMDLQETNDFYNRNSSSVENSYEWSDRPKVSDPTWSTNKGVPVEILIELANTADCDLWMQIHHTCSDDYITELAALATQKLKRRLILGFSNEVWNARMFKQAGDIAIWSMNYPTLRAPSHDSLNATYLSARYVMWRTLRMKRILNVIYDDPSKAQVVFESQRTQPALCADALGWALRAFNEKPDAIAFAPYYGPKPNTLNVQGLLDSCNEAIKQRRDWANDEWKESAWYTMARAFDIKLYCYEGGLDTGYDAINATNRRALSDLPSMRQTTFNYLEQNYEAGVELLCYFRLCCYDTDSFQWGLLQDSTYPTDPKYLGALDYLRKEIPLGGDGLTCTCDNKVTRIDPIINHYCRNYSTGNFYADASILDPRVARECTVVWKGKLKVPTTGAYKFELVKDSNDVVDAKLDGIPLATSLTFAALTSDKPISVDITFKPTFNANGVGSIRLFYIFEETRAVVPQEWLYSA